MRNFHPLSAAIFFTAMVIPLMLVNNPIYTAVSMCGAAAVMCILRGGRDTVRCLAGILILFVFMSLLNPIFVHRGSTPLFFLNGKAITLEAALYGLNSSFSLAAAAVWCRNFSLVMTSERLFCIIGRLSPKIAAMLMMTVRFIPDMIGQAKKFDLYGSLSGDCGGASAFGRLKRYLRVFSALVTWSVENAVQTADSMSARGFELGGRTSYSVFSFKPEDVLLTLLSVCSCSATALLGRFAEVRFYPQTELPSLDTAFAAVLTACAVCFLYPVIFELSIGLRRKNIAAKRGDSVEYESN